MYETFFDRYCFAIVTDHEAMTFQGQLAYLTSLIVPYSSLARKAWLPD